MNDISRLAQAMESAKAVTEAVTQLDRTIRATSNLPLAHLEAISARVQELVETIAATQRVSADIVELARTLNVIAPASVSGEEIAAIQATMERLRANSNTFNSAVEDLNRKLGVELARAYSQVGPTSSVQWSKRWGEYAVAAERVHGALVEDVRLLGGEIPDLVAHPDWYSLTHTDIAIAGMYYSGGLTQAEIGDIVGLSQPAVAGRLPKIDAAIARRVVEDEITWVAHHEGWSLFDPDYEDPGAGLLWDKVASRGVGASRQELALEFKVYRGREPFQRFAGGERPTKSQVLIGCAFYDLERNAIGILVNRDLDHAFSQLDDKIHIATFRDVRVMLPTDTSLDAAYARARP